MLFDRDQIVEMVDELFAAKREGQECANSLLEAIVSILWAYTQRHG